MAEQSFPDEVLMAYADGELDAQTAQLLERALADDRALARRLAVFTRTGDALAQAAAARPLEPVPDALMARVRATLAEHAASEVAENVTAFRPREPQARAAPSRGAAWLPTAIAASLALAVGLGAGFGAGRMVPGENTAAPLPLAFLGTPELEMALSELPTGETQEFPDGRVSVIASFTNADSELCREFEVDDSGGGTVVSVVCHDGAQWQTRLAIVTAPDDGQTYAPASSLDTLEAYLIATGVQAALSIEEEQRALEALRN